ncbi:tetratricopeptide repeat protein [Lysobacter sp. F6437]|uniref:tetratricopeptide repeat protein n=1 Tax=Lysobacter sp. F6437 TaxID=3459296 RepID=UPI00403DFF92
MAQQSRELQRDQGRKDGFSDDAAYPNATRKGPGLRASGRTANKLEKMMKLYDGKKGAEARVIADEIIAANGANAFEQAYAAQIAAQVAYDAGDTATAVKYYQQAIELDGLDNTAHYNVMLNLAQLQQAAGQPDASLATYDRFFSETKSQQPEHLMMKGQALYLMKRYPEAATVMKQAIDASADPKPEWQALLMQAYAEGGQGDQAVVMAEKVAAAKPDDKRAQMNLAIIYQQAGMTDKATAVLEKLRTGGKLTEAAEYQQLYATYINLDGHEKQAVEVIQDGLQKGILKPDFNTYVALAQGYYFSDQPGPAIEAYQKAAPLDDDGETYLNLAKVLVNEGRTAEAQAAAKQALAKGVKKPEQANSIIALPGS